MSDPIKSAKDGVILVGELLKAAGDNPDVKKAGENLGQTALIITKTINNALLPLAAVNFAIDKARQYFAGQFHQDLSAKAAAIPSDQLVEPKASIAGPALQGLAFTHEEPNLKEMYLGLLATAMDGRVAGDAHPAFVEVIKQLNSEEAEPIQQLLRSQDFVPIVEVYAEAADSSWTILQRYLLNLETEVTHVPIENNKLQAIIGNWIRLGLAEVDYTRHLTGASRYAWVEKRPEYLRHKEQEKNKGGKVSYHPGVMTRTAFGIQFGRAVGLL